MDMMYETKKLEIQRRMSDGTTVTLVQFPAVIDIDREGSVQITVDAKEIHHLNFNHKDSTVGLVLVEETDAD
jgi:hypothetical protein